LFACNSAGTKQLFSIAGAIKTKACSRLSVEKTKKAATVKLGICSQQAEDGTAQKCLKCHFGIAPTANDADPTGGCLVEEEEASLEDQRDDSPVSKSYVEFWGRLLHDLATAKHETVSPITGHQSAPPQVRLPAAKSAIFFSHLLH
jgi:hypothetical protein